MSARSTDTSDMAIVPALTNLAESCGAGGGVEERARQGAGKVRRSSLSVALAERHRTRPSPPPSSRSAHPCHQAGDDRSSGKAARAGQADARGLASRGPRCGVGQQARQAGGVAAVCGRQVLHHPLVPEVDQPPAVVPASRVGEAWAGWSGGMEGLGDACAGPGNASPSPTAKPPCPPSPPCPAHQTSSPAATHRVALMKGRLLVSVATAMAPPNRYSREEYHACVPIAPTPWARAW